jgi:hypothetical protein
MKRIPKAVKRLEEHNMYIHKLFAKSECERCKYEFATLNDNNLTSRKRRMTHHSAKAVSKGLQSLQE